MPVSGSSLDLIQASALVGSVLPLIAAVLQQDHYSRRTNAVIAAVVAVAAAVVTAALAGRLTPTDLGGSLVAIATVAVTFHKILWKPTRIAPKVQTATRPRRAQRRASAASRPGRAAADYRDVSAA